MKHFILFVLSIFFICYCTDHSYAAFPLKSEKVIVVTQAATPAINAVSVERTEMKHISFWHKLTHAEDSIYGLFSLLALVFGAVGLIVAFFSTAGFALGLAAVILGAIGLYMGHEQRMATLGIILGAVAIIVALVI